MVDQRRGLIFGISPPPRRQTRRPSSPEEGSPRGLPSWFRRGRAKARGRLLAREPLRRKMCKLGVGVHHGEPYSVAANLPLPVASLPHLVPYWGKTRRGHGPNSGLGNMVRASPQRRKLRASRGGCTCEMSLQPETYGIGRLLELPGRVPGLRARGRDAIGFPGGDDSAVSWSRAGSESAQALEWVKRS